MSEISSGTFEDKKLFLEKNGFYLSTPQGNSMFPFIVGRKDSVVILPCGKELRKYDAILYQREDGAHVLHRIIGRIGEVYIVRGDNCFYKERVLPDEIIGVLSKVYKEGKKEKNVDAKGYRFLVSVWHTIYPLRWCVYALRRLLGRVYRAVRRKGRHGT